MPPKQRRRTNRQPYRGRGPQDNRPGNKIGEIEAEIESVYNVSTPLAPQTQYDQGKPDWQQSLNASGGKPAEEGGEEDNSRVPFDPTEKKAAPEGEDGDDKQASPEELQDREQNGGEATEASQDKAADDELAKLPGQKDDDSLNYNPDDDHQPRFQAARKLLRRRGILIGAGAASGLMIIMAGFFGSMEAVHIRENMLGKGNSLVNEVLDQRRGKSLARTMRQLNRGDFRQRLNKEKFAAKFRENGFKVTFDADGKLTEFGFKDPKTGVYKALDLTDTDYRRSARSFFGREAGDFGRQASVAFDNVTGLRASTWKGKASRRLYAKMRVTFSNWTDTNKPIGQSLDEANASDQASFDSDGNPKDVDGDGTITADEEAGDVASDPASELPEETAAAREAIAAGEDPVARLGIDPDIVDATAGSLDDVAAGASEGILDGLRSGLTTRFPRLGNIAARMTRAISLTEAPRIACRVKGTLNFATNVRNVYLSKELAVFAVRFLTVADHQKAGLIQSSGVKMMMDYLHTPNPINGKTYTNDGGLQNIVFGDSQARPSATNMARYSTARADVGILATIRNIINNVPLTSDTSCKTVNNGLVQIGGAVVGLVAGVFSGGGVTATSVALSIGLGVVEEVAFAVVTPMIVKSMIGAVATGFESGDQAGGMLASGFGSLRSTNASANGLRFGTKAQAAQIQRDADDSAAYARRQQSLFERYLDPYTSDSMFTRMAFAMPRQPVAVASAFANLGQMLSPSSLLSRLPFGTAAAQEADEDPCQSDPQIAALDVPTDVYCNPLPISAPDLDLDITEQILLSHQASRARTVNGKCITETVAAPLINDEGRAVAYPDGDPQCDGTVYMNDDLGDYIDYCHGGLTAESGRSLSGILYDNSDMDKILSGAETAPKASMKLHDFSPQNYDDPCARPGEPLANDAEGIGRFERYAAWYSYKYVDEDNFVEDINEDYSGNGSDVGGGVPASIVSGDTTSISCQAGSDQGVVDGYRQGSLVKIRICNVQGITVNSQISNNINQLLNAAKSAGITLGGSGFRDMATQERLYAENCRNGVCNPDTARPGRSNHQMGLAIDFSQNGQSLCFPDDSATCRDADNAAFDWLESNASKYGLENLPSEAWHWSVGGD